MLSFFVQAISLNVTLKESNTVFRLRNVRSETLRLEGISTTKSVFSSTITLSRLIETYKLREYELHEEEEAVFTNVGIATDPRFYRYTIS